MNHSPWFLLCLGKASALTQESVAWTKERRSKMIPETTRFWPAACVKPRPTVILRYQERIPSELWAFKHLDNQSEG